MQVIFSLFLPIHSRLSYFRIFYYRPLLYPWTLQTISLTDLQTFTCSTVYKLHNNLSRKVLWHFCFKFLTVYYKTTLNIVNHIKIKKSPKNYCLVFFNFTSITASPIALVGPFHVSKTEGISNKWAHRRDLYFFRFSSLQSVELVYYWYKPGL